MQTSSGITSFQVSAFLLSFALGDLVGLSKAFIRMQWKAQSVLSLRTLKNNAPTLW